jgi:hypothetical protein
VQENHEATISCTKYALFGMILTMLSLSSYYPVSLNEDLRHDAVVVQ